MTRMLRGACLCRSVTYEVADAFGYAMNCHCSECRRATGSAFKPFGGLPIGQVRIVTGEDRTFHYGEGIDRDVRCRICGSLLWSVVRDGAFAHVTLGTLDDVPSVEPQAHIFAGSKADWYQIRDDLPQHEALP
ncbi:MAG: GFA family protein [Jannaschia sp.]